MAPTRTRRGKLRRGDAGKLIGAVILAVISLLAVAIGAYFWFTANRPPARDQRSFCPLDGPSAITVMLLDTSDALPQPTKEDAIKRLTDIAEALPDYALLDIRILDPAYPAGRQVFALCNPGDGRGLNEFTGNPSLAKKRWGERFRAPLDRALNLSMQPQPSATSPILSTLQGIALERFVGAAASKIDKSLVIVSDMIENEKDYSQYQGDLSYQRFKGTPAYLKFRTDLNSARVHILYVQRFTKRQINSTQLMQFWSDWVGDNRGAPDATAVRLQGAGQ
jgi:hypothetical protein